VSSTHVHLVAWTEEPWDLEESLFSLVTQKAVAVTVSVAVPARLEPFAAEACARLARLGGPVELRPGTPPSWSPGVEAVAVWTAGTVATPDHLARTLAASGPQRALAVAPARRVLRRAVPGRPPYVLRKTRRFTAPVPSLAELGRDPAFLGRCLVPASRAPHWLPGSSEEHRRWAAEVWAAGPATRVPGPPSIDLPDLRSERAVRSLDDVRDALAELRYQGPRWLERRSPLTFDWLRALYHRLRGGLTEAGRG
jgi:hypothetical protein